MSFFGKVNFNKLSEVDRAIYRYMTDNHSKIPYMRVREIAEESHTSPSSVMRFIRKIGYESFTEFKRYFRIENEMSHTASDFSRGSELLKREHFPKDIDLQLKVVAEKIMHAENIIFFGMGSSGSICEYASRKLAIAGFNSFSMVDPTYPIMSKLRNTANNIVVILSITGRTTEIIEVVNGFTTHPDFETICITSASDSTLALMCDHVLQYYIEVEHYQMYEDMTSQIPCMFVVDNLIKEIITMNKMF